jgi:FAD/FMN-containing dehydrogenase
MHPLHTQLAEIVGRAHVVSDADSMAPYLIEERRLFHGQAVAVVRPSSTRQVAEVVTVCAMHHVPIVPQGGNTGVCGGGVPLPGADGRAVAVVVSTERLNRIRRIDVDNFTVTVEAGCILSHLQDTAREAGCYFPLSLGGEGSCRIGGNLSTNAGGINVLRYGNARDLMLGLEVVLPDGRIWNGLRALRKDNTGYALRHLFVGAEGTLGIITAADLKLFPLPRERQTALIALRDSRAALAVFTRLRVAVGDAVSACELMPRVGIDIGMRNMPGSREPFQTVHPWYLLVELSSPRANGLRDALEEVLGRCLADDIALDAVVAESEMQRKALWRLREINAGGHQHQEGGLIKHDIAVPVSRVPEMIEQGTAACQAALPGVRVIAFGHMGDGNLHFNLVQPVGADSAAFLAERERMNRLVHDIVHTLKGSISAEHGIGMLKIDEMLRYKDPIELELMWRMKRALDPDGLMNPGKVLPPTGA